MNAVENMTAKPRPDSIGLNRVETQIRVAEYLRCVAEYERASQAFSLACDELRGSLLGKLACDELRGSLPGKQRFITTVNYISYLVTSDGEGSFEVEPIENI